MSKKFLSKKRIKKINRLMSHPSLQFVGAGIFTLGAIGGLKVLVERYPFIGDIFREGMDTAQDKLRNLKEEITEHQARH